MNYLIIPSIELQNHKSKFIIEGLPGSQEFYQRLSEFPELLCKLFRLENVKSIHITDIDSFADSDNHNIDNICLMTEATFLPFQALVNFQKLDDCRKILDYGVHRIVLSDSLIDEPEQIKDLIKEYSIRRIIFHYPVQDGRVYFPHSVREFGLEEYAKYIKSLGAERVVLQMTSEDEYLPLIPPKQVLEILKENFQAWTYQYDARNYAELEQLKELQQYNMDSIIISESFYSINFPCQKIWRLAESRLDISGNEIVVD